MLALDAGTRGTGSRIRAIAHYTGSLSGTQKKAVGGMKRMPTKYGNVRTTVDGITFDSKHEATRWIELKYMERAGLITNLVRQMPITLLPAQRNEKGKVIERPVKYIADFMYEENGQKVVEDAKGVKTKEYIIKRKLMLWRYGIRIKEV